MNKRLLRYLPYVVFVLLILLAFRKVLVASGIIGHVWDWGIPYFREQFWDKAVSNFYIWEEAVAAGRYLPLKTEWLYWLIILPFSILGGAAISKLLPVSFLFISAYSMFRLSRSMFKLNPYWSTIAGIFYMFSPFAYGRIIAGHLPVLLGYALLPLVMLYFWRAFSATEKRERLKNTVIGGLLFAFEGIHPATAMLSFVILGVFLLFRLLKSEAKKYILASGLLFVLAFVLVNFFWLFPSVMSYLTTGTVVHGGGLSVSAKGQVTVASEMEPRVEYLKSTSQPLGETFRLHARTGMDTEYVYPVAAWFEVPWTFIAFLLPLLSFGGLLLYRRGEKVLIVAAMALVGILLASGASSLLGSLIYVKFLKKLLPIVFFEFTHPSRALPLVIIAYAILMSYALQNLAERFKSKIQVYSISAVGLILVLLFSYPFMLGDMMEPLNKGTQPMSLKVMSVNPEDEVVYRYFRDNPEDFRLAYVPSWGISWTDSPLNYLWTAFQAPKSELLGWQYHPLNWEILSNLYSWAPTSNIGKLLGLASVKYLVYPDYKFFVSAIDFEPNYVSYPIIDRMKNYKPLVERNLKSQKDLVPIESVFEDVTIFKNESALPHIYATSGSTLIFGEPEILGYLADTGHIDQRPALFFSSQQAGKRAIQDLNAKTAKILVTNNMPKEYKRFSFEEAKNLDYALDVKNSNSGALSASVSTPRDSTYTILVKIDPWDHYKVYSSVDAPVITIGGKSVPTKLVQDNQIENVFWYTGETFLTKGTHQIQMSTPFRINFMGLTQKSDERPSNSPEITFRKKSPVRYEIEVKGARAPYFLIFNESFHPGWKLYHGKMSWPAMLFLKPLAENSHYVVNGYANSWYINKSGSYKLTLYFWPQILFYFGLLISVGTLGVCTGYLVYEWRREKK